MTYPGNSQRHLPTRDPMAWSSWLPSVPEGTATIIDGTTAVTLGAGAQYDARLYGILILKDAAPATVTVAGLNKLGTGGYPTGASVVLTGSTTEDKFIPFHGAINDGAALTVTCSVAAKAIAFWRHAKLHPQQVFTAAPARNAFPAGLRNWNFTGSQSWFKGEYGGGTIAVAGDTATFTSPGGTSQVFFAFDITSILANNLNREIVISVELAEDFTGPTVNGIMAMIGTWTSAGGAAAVNVPAGTWPAGTRFGMRFVASAAVSPAVRFGISVNATEAGAKVIKLRRPVLEIGDARSGGPYGEAVAYASDALFDFVPKISFSNTNEGVITLDRSLKQPAFGEAGLCLGDSFGDDAGLHTGLQGDWPDQLRLFRPELALINRCASGWTLTQIANAIDDWLLAADQSAVARRITKAFTLAGINDIFGSTSLANDPIPAMQTALLKIEASLLAYGLAPENMTFANIAPCLGAASYNSAYGHAGKISRWNAFLRSFCANKGYAHVDTHALLRGGPNGLALDTRYDVGDHLHPNWWGFARIGEGMDLAQRRGAKAVRL